MKKTTDWESELTIIQARQAEISREIKRLTAESDALSAQAKNFRSLELERDHGLSYGDQLAVTDEFRVMLHTRDGWTKWNLNLFCNAPYLVLAHYQHNSIEVEVPDTHILTGLVPIHMAKRMRQAWLSEHSD